MILLTSSIGSVLPCSITIHLLSTVKMGYSLAFLLYIPATMLLLLFRVGDDCIWLLWDLLYEANDVYNRCSLARQMSFDISKKHPLFLRCDYFNFMNRGRLWCSILFRHWT